MQSTTMLFVHDVEATSRWFQSFLDLESGHGGSEFEMLLADGKLLLQLHLIGEEHHDHEVPEWLFNNDLPAPVGNGWRH